jgi:hypothetical protein
VCYAVVIDYMLCMSLLFVFTRACYDYSYLFYKKGSEYDAGGEEQRLTTATSSRNSRKWLGIPSEDARALLSRLTAPPTAFHRPTAQIPADGRSSSFVLATDCEEEIAGG